MGITSRPEARPRVAAGVGDNLSLEFANTAGWHLSAEPAERLTTWSDVARWMVELNLARAADLKGLARAPGDMTSVIALREEVFDIGLALSAGEKPGADRIAALARHAERPGPTVSVGRDGLRWAFTAERVTDELTTVIARDALTLFCSPRAGKIRRCQGGDCGWLFIDESRAGRRRWCSMDDCGARAKAKRHYDRSKSARAG